MRIKGTRYLWNWLAIISAAILPIGSVGAADGVAAKVNGEEIFEALLVKELKARYGRAMLEEMIEALAVRQKAAERGIEVTSEEVTARYEQTMRDVVATAPIAGYSDEQLFALWLAKQGLTPQTFREEIALQLMLQKMVADQVEVTEQEVAQYYEANRKQLELREAVRVRHICVTTPEEAERIRQDIVAGRITFEEAAKQYSIDPYGRGDGSLLPWLGRGKLPRPEWAPLRDEAFTLQKDGDISPVFQTVMGYEILRREAYQRPGTPPFEDIQEELTQRLYDAKLLQAAREMGVAILKLAKIERIIQFPSPGQDSSEAAVASE